MLLIHGASQANLNGLCPGAYSNPDVAAESDGCSAAEGSLLFTALTPSSPSMTRDSVSINSANNGFESATRQ